MLVEEPSGVGLHVKLYQIVVLPAVVVVPHGTKHVHSALAIVPVDAGCKVHILSLIVIGLGIKREALALRTLGLDEDNALHIGFVLRARIGDEFHTLDVVALELVELALVAHLAAVDVDERCALAKHL